MVLFYCIVLLGRMQHRQWTQTIQTNAQYGD